MSAELLILLLFPKLRIICMRYQILFSGQKFFGSDLCWNCLYPTCIILTLKMLNMTTRQHFFFFFFFFFYYWDLPCMGFLIDLFCFCSSTVRPCRFQYSTIYKSSYMNIMRCRPWKRRKPLSGEIGKIMTTDLLSRSI